MISALEHNVNSGIFKCVIFYFYWQVNTLCAIVYHKIIKPCMDFYHLPAARCGLVAIHVIL